MQKKALKIFINLKKEQLKDPENMARIINDIGHWGNSNYQIILNTVENIDYVMMLIKQSYKINNLFD